MRILKSSTRYARESLRLSIRYEVVSRASRQFENSPSDPRSSRAQILESPLRDLERNSTGSLSLLDVSRARRLRAEGAIAIDDRARDTSPIRRLSPLVVVERVAKPRKHTRARS
jgi:hypothetical protein